MKTNDSKSLTPSLQKAIRKVRLVAFDFDGVFTDNMVYVMQDGTEAVRCNRSDGIGLQKLARLGIKTVIISTESNPVVSTRASKLKIRCLQDCQDKQATLKDIAQELGISMDEVAFIGNDVNDLTCLTIVGLPIVVNDAHPEVISSATYRTNARGGFGAVREICDLMERELLK